MSQFFCPDAAEVPAVKTELLRYLGIRRVDTPDSMTDLMSDRAIKDLAGIIVPRIVYDFFDIAVTDGCCSFFRDSQYCFEVHSKDLSRNFQDCTQAVLFAATIGPMVDAFIRRAQAADPAEASVLQAAGAMYVESLVDLFNEKIKSQQTEKGGGTKPRFSPGFGDVNLEVQKDFFRFLDCRKIGLTLMDTLIMAPEKSVTAFIGIQPFNP